MKLSGNRVDHVRLLVEQLQGIDELPHTDIDTGHAHRPHHRLRRFVCWAFIHAFHFLLCMPLSIRQDTGLTVSILSYFREISSFSAKFDMFRQNPSFNRQQKRAPDRRPF